MSNTETGAPCEGSSAPRATCRTAGSTGPRSPRRSARAAARAPARSRPTTRTPRRWASRRRARAARRRPTGARPTRCGSRPPTPPTSTRTTPPSIHAALRLDTDAPAPRLRRRACARASAPCGPRSGSSDHAVLVATADIRTGLPTSADESRGRRRRGRAARRRRRRHGPVIAEYLGAGVGRPRSSSTAGARPGDVAHQAVGGALRRDAVRARSASRRGTRRSRPPGSSRRAGRPWSSSPACTPGP